MELLFDVELAKQQEARRRLAILGDYAHKELDAKQLRTLAADSGVPRHYLIAWKQQFTQQGLAGLVPQDWMPLTEKLQEVVQKRFCQLGALIDATSITTTHISALALQLDGSSSQSALRKAQRLIRRYQIGGVWGLAPERHPEKTRERVERPLPALATVSSDSLKIADQRQDLIKPFLGRKAISNKELEEYGKEKGISLRSLRKYLQSYQQDGLQGLLPKEERSDKGHLHDISQRMIDIITGIRLSQRDIPLHQVHTLANQKATLLAEPPPSLWQIRRVCGNIPKEVTEIADGRYNEYRNHHRTTYRYHFDGSIIIYQLDFTQIPVLVQDIRRRSARSKSSEVRPRLTICLECSGRLIMGYLFTYDDPSSDEIACVLHDALLVTQQKPYGGIPHEAWVDKGPQFISRHMRRIARDLQFDLHECTPNHKDEEGAPQKKGKVERFFRTLDQKLWSTLPGYVHSNPQERNPHAKSELTLKQLEVKFQKFLASYHLESHSETGQAPLEFWADHCFALPADPRGLDMLLLRTHSRTHSKEGVEYANRTYWYDKLANEISVGDEVELRAAPAYTKPDTVEVFYNHQWICTATARDSDAGRAVTGKQVLTAQRRQESRIRETIKESQQVLKQADQEIKEKQVSPPSQNQTTPSPGGTKKTSVQQHTTRGDKVTPIQPKAPLKQKARENAWNTITSIHQQVQQRSNKA